MVCLYVSHSHGQKIVHISKMSTIHLFTITLKIYQQIKEKNKVLIRL